VKAPGDRTSTIRRVGLAAGAVAVPVAVIITPAAAVAAVTIRTATATATAAAGTGTTSPPGARTAGPSTRAPTVPVHAGPRLSISVTDGRTEVTAGDRLTYTVTLRNAGTAAVRHITVTQTLPQGIRLISASAGGTAAHGRIAWHAAVPPGRAAVFTSSEQVIRIPARQLRLAAVACADLSGSSRPVVCAADLTDTPTTAEAAASGHASAPAGGGWVGYAAAGGGVAIAAGVIAATLTRRNRGRRRVGRVG
jgi:uncharacterized repeat protein (TIGR01451 family)